MTTRERISTCAAAPRNFRGIFGSDFSTSANNEQHEQFLAGNVDFSSHGQCRKQPRHYPFVTLPPTPVPDGRA